MIKQFTLLLLSLVLLGSVQAAESEFFIREDINKLNFRTDVNAFDSVVNKVSNFITKNQKNIDENMFVFECRSLRCEKYANKIKLDFLKNGKTQSYIRIDSLSSRLGSKYDMVFKIIKYKVMKPSCSKLSINNFEDDMYNTDTPKSEYDPYCGQLYIETLSSKNLEKKLNLDTGNN